MPSVAPDSSIRERENLRLKGLTGFVAFIAGMELLRLFTYCSEWVSMLVGIGLWSVVTYLEPPRPRLWKVLLATASLVVLVLVIHLLHFGRTKTL